MRNLFKNIHELYFPILLIIFSIVFKNKTTELITDILVNPLLSTIEYSTYLIDSILIASSFYFILSYLRKAYFGIKIGKIFQIYIITVTIIYSFYRISDSSEFLFVSLKLCEYIYLSDMLLIPLVTILLYHIVSFFRHVYIKKNTPNNAIPLLIDSSLVLNDDNDSNGRLLFAQELKDRIICTDFISQSFAIGIVGPWGSGKTTFMDTLKKQLDSEQNVIQMEFNPWIILNSQGITPLFFSELSSKLSEYDNSLKHKISTYCDELLKVSDGSFSQILPKFISFFIVQTDLNSKRLQINNSIESLDKKIIIYIDDLDRLQANEILDVLKLIRNSANFVNTFFVVAFDRGYVLNNIKKSLMGKVNDYLEKIFQLEYYLPVSPDSNIYTKTLIKYLSEKINNEKQLKVLEQIFSKNINSFTKIEYVPPIQKHIRSFRDVNRFINIFFINYQKIENNIYLPDYISICLLRLKYPDMYQELYYLKNVFLTIPINYLYEDSYTKLSIQFDERKGSKIEESKIYKYFLAKMERYAMNEEDCFDSVELVFDIFNNQDKSGNIQSERTLSNSELSIVNSACFDRYFDCLMEGRLDNAEFEEALLTPTDQFLNKISEWIKVGTISDDLQFKFENFKNFDSVEIYEKIILGIIHFANSKNRRDSSTYTGFSFDVLYRLLGSGPTTKENIIKEIYKNDELRYVTFIKSLFSKNDMSIPWNYMNSFAINLINIGHNEFIIPHEELKELIAESFLKSIDKIERLDKNIWSHYMFIVRHFSAAKENETIKPQGTGVVLTNRIKELISNDPYIFLQQIIHPSGVKKGCYVYYKWEEVIFGSHDEFLNFLLQFEQTEYIKEYYDFYAEWKVKEDKEGVPFKFNHIMIKD